MVQNLRAGLQGHLVNHKNRLPLLLVELIDFATFMNRKADTLVTEFNILTQPAIFSKAITNKNYG